MSTSPAAPLPTRQQLDEIDAILKRMLTLPPLPGEPAATTPSPAPAVREVPPAREPGPGEPIVREWRVEWSQPPQSVASWGAPVAAPPAPVYPPRAEEPVYAMPVPVGEQLPFAAPAPPNYVPGQPPPAPAEPPPTLPMQFLSLLNNTFNVLTYLLGPLGTWLRGPGRNALGWAGILMLVAAAAWATGEWLGYDWPRVDLSRFGLPAVGPG